MPARRPLNYTTQIKAKVTVAQCQDLLGEAGAQATSVLFRDRKPVGLAFTIDTPFGMRSYRLPVNGEGVAALLRQVDAENGWPPGLLKNPRTIRLYLTEEHAWRVAWRVARDWLEAQLAIIDASMVSLDQVMLPYMEVEGAAGPTVYDRYLATSRAALEAG